MRWICVVASAHDRWSFVQSIFIAARGIGHARMDIDGREVAEALVASALSQNAAFG